ncbi:hypothetical protein [uncultured Paludibaculum sp.]|uniref:hypothetical protein n=1 Tax=uncultured Paludibaculum sp. TaxID=1765020 RepID=UPI002AAAE1B2|nr:hypothetical protein [uncultured Paludibaculum sp.]
MRDYTKDAMDTRANRTYSLEDAAKIFPHVSVSDLKNYIKRKYLRHVGDRPLAGERRVFDLWGVYEIGLLLALKAEGASLSLASKVVWHVIANRKSLQNASTPSRSAPELLSSDSFAHDLSRPRFLLFFNERGEEPEGLDETGYRPEDYATTQADGPDDLKPAVARLYHQLALRLYRNPSYDHDQAHKVETDYPAFQVFNLTAALIPIDKALHAFLDAD